MTETREVRATVKALVERDGRYLLLNQVYDPGDPAGYVWTLPGGGVDFGERPREALRREVHEETALTVDVGDPLDAYAFEWTAGDRRVHSVATVFAATPAADVADGSGGGSTASRAVDVTDNPADEPIVDHGWFAPGGVASLRMDPALADLFERLFSTDGGRDDRRDGG